MNPTPTQVERLADKIKITWSDNVVQEIGNKDLRQACPCATCQLARGDLSHEKPLTKAKPSLLNVIEHSDEEEISLLSIGAVGNYALSFQWGDGHSSGIYRYEHLRSITLS